MKKTLLIITFLILAFSCKEKVGSDTTIWIYQMKNDYSNNVPVELSPDKSKITGAPGGDINTRFPVSLIDGYFLGGSFGPNSGYLSLTIEEYNTYTVKPGVDSLYKMLIEKDPFVSFYQRHDDNGTFHSENGYNGYDTSFLNELIRNDELEKYFEKLK